MIYPVTFEVIEAPSDERLSQSGEYVFSIIASNLTSSDTEDAIKAVAKLWEMEDLPAEIMLKLNIRLRSVFEGLCDNIEEDGSIPSDKKPLFAAMRSDCQWVIDCLNDLDF